MPNTWEASSSPLRWLYVDFNSYFASVEQQEQPKLRHKPIIVVPVQSDATCAIAASYEAKAHGIKTGTPVWEAKKKCPSIISVLAQHEKYVDYHGRILEEIDRHIPIHAVCSIDEMACTLMDNETSIQRATEIALSIKQGLKRNLGEYLRCSIGIAQNRYLAKVATELKKPDGLTILTASDLPERLYELKLRDLPGIGRNIELRLNRSGIYTMEHLLKLDASSLRKLWGSVEGEKMWYLLRGIHVEEEPTTRRTLGHSHVMAPELRSKEKALYVARRLTLKAASRLRRMEYYAGALSLSARLEEGSRLEGSLSCYRAQDSMTFLHLLDQLWQALYQQIGDKRIKKLSITLHQLIPASQLQPELFDTLESLNQDERMKAEKISNALDKINHRFGRDSILVGMLPNQGRTFSGTKIAFTRIPDVEEFLE